MKDVGTDKEILGPEEERLDPKEDGIRPDGDRKWYFYSNSLARIQKHTRRYCMLIHTLLLMLTFNLVLGSTKTCRDVSVNIAAA